MATEVARTETAPLPTEVKVRRKAAKRTSKRGPPNPLDTLNVLAVDKTRPDGGNQDHRKQDAGKPDSGGKKQTKPAKERTELLNFRVTPDFRRAFKRAVAANGCKKHELLERMFTKWDEAAPS